VNIPPSQRVSHLQPSWFQVVYRRCADVLHCGRFLIDYLCAIFNDRHTIRPRSYQLMRVFYSRTKGRSARWLARPFELLYPPKLECTSHEAPLLGGLGSNGYFHQQTVDDSVIQIATSISQYLAECPVYEVESSLRKGARYATPFLGLKSRDRHSPRLNHDRTDVVSCPAVWQLLAKLRLPQLASSYLRCDPLLTSVDSWHVLPIGVNDGRQLELYGAAAQTYHYDLDWIRFLKVFVNLSDVTSASGPFEFVAGTHRIKHDRYFRDGRFDCPQDQSDSIVYAIGDVGTYFVADTSGLHRDGRALAGQSRHVLQFEFAISAFGAKFQYLDSLRHSSAIVNANPFLLPSTPSRRLFGLFVSPV